MNVRVSDCECECGCVCVCANVCLSLREEVVKRWSFSRCSEEQPPLISEACFQGSELPRGFAYKFRFTTQLTISS